MAESSAMLAVVTPPLAAALLAAQDTSPQGSILGLLAPLIPIAVLFYFLMIVPQRNRERTFRGMLDGLKANDHIVTIGGIHGVVTNIQRDQGRVTVRVDDSTNAKLTFNISAIERVISAETSPKKSGDSK